MSVYTIATAVQLVDTTDLTITETAGPTLVAPTAGQICLYANVLDADDFRKSEHHRGWHSLYKGWKRVAYDAFNGASAGIPHYIAADLSIPTPEYRIYTTDLLLVVEGMIGFGIGADFTALAAVGKNTVPIRSAFDRLRDYYLETRK